MTKPELIRTIDLLLKSEGINNPKHPGAKEGLQKAAEILQTGQKDLDGIEKLSTAQARAIAKFAVDFNNLQHDGSFFVKLGEVIKSKKRQ